MKRQVRRGVFETNSSSTHSLTMCTAEEYEQWKRGKLMLDTYNDVLVEMNIELTEQDKEEAKKYYESTRTKYWKEWSQLSEEEVDEWYDKYISERDKINRYQYKTYDEYLDEGYASCLERFEDRYTTKNGEVIVAFGFYGYDG